MGFELRRPALEPLDEQEVSEALSLFSDLLLAEAAARGGDPSAAPALIDEPPEEESN